MASQRAFLLILIFLTFFINTIFADPCPRPKVKIEIEIGKDVLKMIQDDYGFKTEQGWKNEVASKVEKTLKENSEGIEIYKGQECPDFRLNISLKTNESFHYWVTSSLVGMGKGYIIDELQIRRGTDIDSLLSQSVKRFGDIGALIKAREEKHPWPARNPSFKVTVDPQEISPKKGDDQSTISVKVFHCNGKLADFKQEVYFSTETSRGKVNWKQNIPGKNGAVVATYKLDYSKGTHPGTDKIKIWTHGYCKKEYATEAIIKIKPSKGILEIEKTGSELGICHFESRCVVQLPFEMVQSKNSENYEIKGGDSNRISYKLKCKGCNVITGTFWARVTGGVLDLENNPEKPLSISFEIFRDNEIHKITCVKPPIIMRRKKQQYMNMKLYKWPLTDRYSEQIGVFKYTLYLKKQE